MTIMAGGYFNADIDVDAGYMQNCNDRSRLLVACSILSVYKSYFFISIMDV